MIYVTSQGDMWDKIALEVYGSEHLMHILIDANPKYRKVLVFSANCELNIPELPRQRVNNIPLPWRGSA
ncbi:MAG: tail protein X [Oscillospiraceae bacterium]|nr:tail protein X [Oscillospiraceae bacterium]